MSKPVKKMMRDELIRRFQGLSSLAVVDFTGVDAVSNHQIRARLLEKDIHVSVVKNSLARQAFREVGLDDATAMLEGPSAVAYGSDSVVSVVRELLAIARETPALTVKSAYMEGDVFGTERIEELSKYPTREEAIAKVIGALLGTGGGLLGALLGPGRKVGSLLKAIEEKHEDATEEVAA